MLRRVARGSAGGAGGRRRRPPDIVGLAATIQWLTNVVGHSVHWECLFPQHGPGRKHERSITLQDWQQEIVDRYSGVLLRGLIHFEAAAG